jgi:hypothetical protein
MLQVVGLGAGYCLWVVVRGEHRFPIAQLPIQTTHVQDHTATCRNGLNTQKEKRQWPNARPARSLLHTPDCPRTFSPKSTTTSTNGTEDAGRSNTENKEPQTHGR